MIQAAQQRLSLGSYRGILALQLIYPSRACGDPERARLLRYYALHRASADAQRLAYLQYARAALVEAQDALFRSSSTLRSLCFLLVLDDFMKQNSALAVLISSSWEYASMASSRTPQRKRPQSGPW